MRLLLVEDDKIAADLLIERLAGDGDDIVYAENGEDGAVLARETNFDALIVDRMMPKLDGLSMVRGLREAGVTTPVLFLTALGSVQDRVEGLQAGGDDYLVKPFAYAELRARLEALGRRKPAAQDTSFSLADLTLDVVARRVRRGEVEISLQAREFSLLEYLLRHKQQVVTRSMLLEHVWNYRFDTQTNVIDVHISRLRNKLDKGFETPLLHTVRGRGFILQLPDMLGEV
ncbi:response regulator transcription factor [Alphaproteobacteria bacterium]|nr:response regulator transcription factor [Alphaproteobacteria bacterium]MDB2668746.1 response regulator transcription factor [Alphaproteobacteria bacterium]MDC0131642.1 response regulator transcription factor [Alphaproteobacteria bacterium]MDC0147879.1 response regulator transcription factor [Alphaproteobacteria bacterium]